MIFSDIDAEDGGKYTLAIIMTVYFGLGKSSLYLI